MKTSIISPHRRLYANEGSFSDVNLSIYVKFLIPGNSFVALLWTFSIAIICHLSCFVYCLVNMVIKG